MPSRKYPTGGQLMSKGALTRTHRGSDRRRRDSVWSFTERKNFVRFEPFVALYYQRHDDRWANIGGGVRSERVGGSVRGARGTLHRSGIFQRNSIDGWRYSLGAGCEPVCFHRLGAIG